MALQQLVSSSSSNLLASSSQVQPIQIAEAFYQADHQAEFLHLQADADALLTQLKALKYQRLILSNAGSSHAVSSSSIS